MAVGLVSVAPIYLNGLLALLCVFILPGLIFVRAFDIPNFPQRMLVIISSSLATNYFLVVLIATLHLNPLETYRDVVLVLATAFASLTVMDFLGRKTAPWMRHDSAVVLKSDFRWLALSLALVCLAYFNIWKRGVPNIFLEGDVSISWNTWALIWSHGLFPTGSYGYPQLIPTLWAVSYIFTGSVEHYFAYYIYIVLIIVPLVLTSAYLGRAGWLPALLPVVTFVWFVAEIQDPWLRATLPAGFPDWTAAVCGFCGLVLFINNDPSRQFDREKITTALASLCLILLAAATKPIYGLFALAVLLRLCLDAAALLSGRDRRRFLAAAIGLFAAFAAAYLVMYWHLTVRSLPGDPVSDLGERLRRSVRLFNSNFTLPFRILACVGIALSPFLPRIRWLTLPLLLGTCLWAATASYDMRNLFGVLLIGAFIPLFAASRKMDTSLAENAGSRWKVPDAAVAALLAVFAVGSTFTLAVDDAHLNARFNSEQFRIGAGADFNTRVEQLLGRGCVLLTGADYIYTISTFAKYLPQLEYFHASLPLPEPITKKFDEQHGCTGIMYPPARSLASVAEYVKAKSEQRQYVTAAASLGWVLLTSPP
jgi:hypothetical protein